MRFPAVSQRCEKGPTFLNRKICCFSQQRRGRHLATQSLQCCHPKLLICAPASRWSWTHPAARCFSLSSKEQEATQRLNSKEKKIFQAHYNRKTLASALRLISDVQISWATSSPYAHLALPAQQPRSDMGQERKESAVGQGTESRRYQVLGQ